MSGKPVGKKYVKIYTTVFRVPEGDDVDLGKWPTTVNPVYKSKKKYHKMLEDHVAQLSSQRQLLYASNRYAVRAVQRWRMISTESARPQLRHEVKRLERNGIPESTNV